MTTELQQALVDDALPVVQRKIALGSYPQAVFRKALDAKAWVCAQWLVHAYPKALSAWDWHELASNKSLVVDPEVVRLAHAHGIERNVSRSWKNSAVAWEWAGVLFPLSFYDALWKTSGIAFKTRGQLFELGKMHRFGPVEAWLRSEVSPTESEIKDVFKQLWDHALLHSDGMLLEWLSSHTSRPEVMNHIHNCISARSLALPSVLLRRAGRIEWSVETFLEKGLAGLKIPVEEFCQYMALYDTPRLKHVWSKMSVSESIPVEWRSFLSSGAKLPEDGNAAQGIVLILHALFPTAPGSTDAARMAKTQPKEEAMRMQQCFEASSSHSMSQADLVDLL